MKNFFVKTFLLLAVILVAALLLYTILPGTPSSINPDNIFPVAASSSSATASSSVLSVATTTLALPINDALKRVTKKPFGIKVSPGHSPVSPERFSGYHTGADFETFPGEKNINVPIFAICDGTLLYRKSVNGYGGVAIQSCHLDNQDVTVLYGHLKLTSINLKTGAKLKAGKQIAVLGKGYSAETSGERKHLHLGIHKGKNIVLLGYVQIQSELNNWIDPLKYLK